MSTAAPRGENLALEGPEPHAGAPVCTLAAAPVLRDKQAINLSINLSDQINARSQFIPINKPAGDWRLFLFE